MWCGRAKMTVRETIPGQVGLGRVRKLAEHNPKWDNKQCPPMISTSGYCFESLPWGTQWWAITWKCPADNTMVYNNTFSLLSGFDHSVHHRNRKHTKRSYNQQPMQMKNTSIDSTPQPRIQGQSHSATESRTSPQFPNSQGTNCVLLSVSPCRPDFSANHWLP